MGPSRVFGCAQFKDRLAARRGLIVAFRRPAGGWPRFARETGSSFSFASPHSSPPPPSLSLFRSEMGRRGRACEEDGQSIAEPAVRRPAGLGSRGWLHAARRTPHAAPVAALPLSLRVKRLTGCSSEPRRAVPCGGLKVFSARLRQPSATAGRREDVADVWAFFYFLVGRHSADSSGIPSRTAQLKRALNRTDSGQICTFIFKSGKRAPARCKEGSF